MNRFAAIILVSFLSMSGLHAAFSCYTTGKGDNGEVINDAGYRVDVDESGSVIAVYESGGWLPEKKITVSDAKVVFNNPASSTAKLDMNINGHPLQSYFKNLKCDTQSNIPNIPNSFPEEIAANQRPAGVVDLSALFPGEKQTVHTDTTKTANTGLIFNLPAEAFPVEARKGLQISQDAINKIFEIFPFVNRGPQPFVTSEQ